MMASKVVYNKVILNGANISPLKVIFLYLPLVLIMTARNGIEISDLGLSYDQRLRRLAP